MLSRNSISDLAPYIASAAVVAFSLGYFAQPYATAASGRVSARIETAQPMNVVDRSHKGDRLSGVLPSYGQPASDSRESGNMESRPDQTVPRRAPRSSTLQPTIPDGCDPALGPLLTTEQGNFAGRCVV